MSIGYVAFRACESINLSSSLTSMQQSTATMKVGVSDMVWGARRGAYMTKYRYNTMYMLVMMESLLNNHYDMIKCENRRRRVSEKLFVCKYLLIITWWIFPSTQKNTLTREQCWLNLPYTSPNHDARNGKNVVINAIN